MLRREEPDYELWVLPGAITILPRKLIYTQYYNPKWGDERPSVDYFFVPLSEAEINELRHDLEAEANSKGWNFAY